MTITPHSSRQRLLAALNWQLPDRIPGCFMSFTALRKKNNDHFLALALAEQKMGFDPMLFIPAAPRSRRKDHPELRGLPVRFHPDVMTEEWHASQPGSPGSLHKIYQSRERRQTLITSAISPSTPKKPGRISLSL